MKKHMKSAQRLRRLRKSYIKRNYVGIRSDVLDLMSDKELAQITRAIKHRKEKLGG